jgi:hypothetical protein
MLLQEWTSCGGGGVFMMRTGIVQFWAKDSQLHTEAADGSKHAWFQHLGCLLAEIFVIRQNDQKHIAQSPVLNKYIIKLSCGNCAYSITSVLGGISEGEMNGEMPRQIRRTNNKSSVEQP